MTYTTDQIAEIGVLIRYRLDSGHQGIKVHSTADSTTIAAVRRLYDKGLVTQQDGGYLTDPGRKAAEHAQALLLMLSDRRMAS